MQISAHTTRAELERLYTAATRQELLRSTPMNLRMFLRYAVLFVLFPGMVGGFRVGLGLALAFCVLLGALLMSGHQQQAVLATRVWLTAGACVLAWVSCTTVRSALAVMRLRRCPRKADSPAAARDAAPPPAEQLLRWRRSAERPTWVAESEYCAPADCICALLICVEGAGRGRLLTPERRGVCVVHSAAQGDSLQVLLLYRLEPGLHRLCWEFAPAGALSSTAPSGRVCLLCSPQG